MSKCDDNNSKEKIMEEKEEITKYLNAIYQNTRTAIQSINEIIKKATSKEFISELSNEEDAYSVLAKECENFAKAEKIEGLKDNNFIEKAVELDLIVVIEGNKPQRYYNLGLTIRGVRAGYLVSQLELIFLDWEEYFVTRARLNTSFKRKIPISEACYNYGIIVSKEVPMPFPFDGDGLRITFDMDDMVLPGKNDASLKSKSDAMNLY